MPITGVLKAKIQPKFYAILFEISIPSTARRGTARVGCCGVCGGRAKQGGVGAGGGVHQQLLLLLMYCSELSAQHRHGLLQLV